jgi:hypothetical protein
MGIQQLHQGAEAAHTVQYQTQLIWWVDGKDKKLHHLVFGPRSQASRHQGLKLTPMRLNSHSNTLSTPKLTNFHLYIQKLTKSTEICAHLIKHNFT